MNVLVTGGAGYIGSFVCRSLSEMGHSPIVVDSLERGHEWAVKWGPLYEGNVGDKDLIKKVVVQESISAVIHLAAYAYVGESIANPQLYFQNNTEVTKSLLEALSESEGIEQFIFSSSCATYGCPTVDLITESTQQNPVNPYGMSKLLAEQIVSEYSKASGIPCVLLRYFNACGAADDLQIGAIHDPETRVIPLIIRSVFDPQFTFQVYGQDYATQDGTCIRDYVHVQDLAKAHTLALANRADGCTVYNIGTARGVSVMELIRTVEAYTGKKVKYRVASRREGDPAVLVANHNKIQAGLGWSAQHSRIENIIQTATDWYTKHNA